MAPRGTATGRWLAAAMALVAFAAAAEAYLPVVMWHGMGDSCCSPFSMGRLKRLIQDAHNGTYVYSIMIGSNIIADTEHGFLGNVNDQVSEVCAKLQADPLLADGYHAVGISQGGQFLRAIVQKCPDPPMKNLAALASQQQGVFGFPDCTGDVGFCEQLRQLLTEGAYVPWVQERLVQAEYWHDPLNETLYREGNIFLADLNQENVINEDYRTNLQKLENFVLVKFLQDITVIPRESSWFGFYKPGQDVERQTLQESTLYTEDRLGLKAMDEAGKLQFLTFDGPHVSFTDEWFLEAIVEPYFT